MSKVSVTGSKAVMDQVIETLHEINRVHLTEYDGSWEAFDNGDPVEGAEEASDRLVTIRGLQSTLDLDEEAVSSARGFDPEELDDRLAEVRSDVNELDDRRQAVRQELREVEERIDALEPFARLGIDLDLLTGYDHIEVVVGEGDEATVREAYGVSDKVRGVETFSGDGVVAAAIAPAEGVDHEDAASDPLVGVDFTRLAVPDTDGSPEDAVAELRQERRRLDAELESIEADLEGLTHEVGDFLVAAEEYLAIQVQKGEAPLSFATTENSFVAEGWIPTAELEEIETALTDAVGDHVEFEELERAAYDRHGNAHHAEYDSAGSDGGSEAAAGATGAAATAEGDRAVADGGVVTVADDPPTVQRNPEPTTPFEVLTRAVGRPSYSELDPTIVLFLTFPVFFGFMIGDVGYGVIYALLGLFAMRRFDSDAINQFGMVVVWAGICTVAFGVLYGEIFGLHKFGEWVWGGHPPLRKGLSYKEWAPAWLVVAVLAGWVHLTVGWALDFVDNYTLHGLKDAVFESGSWIALLTGIWLWVFSTHMGGDPTDPKPMLLYRTFDGHPFALGFSGFPPAVGYLGGGLMVLGIALLIVGPRHELPEIAQPFAHTLSYTRLTAVLLSKAGMALVANMLYFGAYTDAQGRYHFLIDHGPHYVETHEGAEMVFSGLFHAGIAGQIGGLIVLLLGHIVVLAIGVSAMIQAIRLEYVEFFGKFYEGGGKTFDPFGYERNDTTED